MKKIFSGVVAGIMALSLVFMQVHAADSYGDLFTTPKTPTTMGKEYKQKFWDVEKNHWAFQYIAELADRGAINGYSDGAFKPENTVTRAEWAKIMIQVAGLTANDYSLRFTDMTDHWAIPYVNAASAYLTAFADNSYRPDQAVTREDVTMSMVKLKGYNLSDVDYSVLSRFQDVASISNSMKVYVAMAVEKGLISGFEDGTFRGQATLTRAEAATLLWRAFQFGNDNKGNASSSGASDYSGGSSVVQPSNPNVQPTVPETPVVPTTPVTSLTVADLNGTFGDTVSQRASMKIAKNGSTYKINIEWPSSASERTEWFFDAKLNKSSGSLAYENGYEFTVVENEDGTFSWSLENEECEGTFTLEADVLSWNDESEDLKGRCLFEKVSDEIDDDATTSYAEAQRAVKAYLKICMNRSEYYEKELVKEYNQARGWLLSCYGYRDSDELLEKLASVHQIGLKISKISGFHAASVSMRDSKVVAEGECSSSGDITFEFSYDYQQFSAEIDLFEYCKNSHYASIALSDVVGLFASDYRDAEFRRLMKEADEQARAESSSKDEIEFEMYYGGYNLEISYRGYYDSLTITGTKGAKKPAQEPAKKPVKEESSFDDEEDIPSASEHTHRYSGWKDDMNGMTHSQKCSCGEQKTEKHRWDSWEIYGSIEERKCRECSATEMQDHTHSLVYDESLGKYPWKCTTCHLVWEYDPEVGPTERTKDYLYERKCNYCSYNDESVILTVEYGVKTDVKWTCSSCGKANHNTLTVRW